MKTGTILFVIAGLFLSACTVSNSDINLNTAIPSPVPVSPTSTIVPSLTTIPSLQTTPVDQPTLIPTSTPVSDTELEKILNDLDELNIDDDLGELDKLY